MNCFFAFKHTDIQAANPHCRKTSREPIHAKHDGFVTLRSQELLVSRGDFACVHSFRGFHEYHELAKSTRCPLYALMKQWILQTYGKAASEEEDFSETDEGSLFIDIFTIFTGADFSGFMHIYI